MNYLFFLLCIIMFPCWFYQTLSCTLQIEESNFFYILDIYILNIIFCEPIYVCSRYSLFYSCKNTLWVSIWGVYNFGWLHSLHCLLWYAYMYTYWVCIQSFCSYYLLLLYNHFFSFQNNLHITVEHVSFFILSSTVHNWLLSF